MTLQDGPTLLPVPVPVPVRVRELEGDERATWWERAVETDPDYADYQANTDRLIPVFLATPRTEESP